MLGEKQTKIRAREDGFPAVMKHKNIAPWAVAHRLQEKPIPRGGTRCRQRVGHAALPPISIPGDAQLAGRRELPML
jgi:hypothetical protein